MEDDQIREDEIEELFKKLDEDAEASGYILNPDTSFTKSLVRGLLVNRKRYGYQACPCRLASGTKEVDLDIICPCDYRDPDLDQYGACYCALYIDEDIKSGRKKVKPIPDRRMEEKEEKQSTGMEKSIDLKYPVWRCKVCGYLCARENPPAVCPVCKAERERFELFIDK
jgi:ferredoxin-thioredoxin reductase catalytic subunit/rubredoxin